MRNKSWPARVGALLGTEEIAVKRTLWALAFASVASVAVAQTSDAPDAKGRAPDSVRERIEADGYKDVQGLAMGADGLWHGRAMRGSTEVAVTVDAKGKVAAQ
jgi:hypothetical protein